MALGIMMLTTSRLPVFMVGTSAVQMLEDLGNSPMALGTALAAFFGSAGCMSIVGGSLVARYGASPGLRWGPVLTLFCLIGIARQSDSWFAVTAWLAVGGIATAIVEPAINQTLSAFVPPARQGIAFALKQSANPLAVMVGSLVVPLITLRFGWRASYWSATIAAVVAMATAASVKDALPKRRSAGRKPLQGQRVRVTVFGMLGACGAVVGNAAGGFGATVMASAGLHEAFVGILLTACSIGAILTRVVVGVMADRQRRSTTYLIAVLLVVGVVGCVLIATGEGVVVVIGCFAVFLGGWGWPGLLHLQLVRYFGDDAGIASGVMLAGVAAGSAGGPLVFGASSSWFGAGATWWLMAAVGLVGVGLNERLAGSIRTGNM